MSKELLSNEQRGAVDFNECPEIGSKMRWGSCRCGPCAVCGHQKHTAVHGPMFGEPAGSKPWDHEYVAPVSALQETPRG